MKKLIVGLLMVASFMSVVACNNMGTTSYDLKKFERSVFMGDSITEGFAFNEILTEEQVLAGTGTTAGFIYDDVDILIERSPENIFIMLGSVDLLMPVDDPKQLFENEFEKLIEHIKNNLPNSNIYLQSITPVGKDAVEKEPRYKNIEYYNKIIIELADRMNVTYVDIASLAAENTHLLAEDGVHFKKELYYLWLEKVAELL